MRSIARATKLTTDNKKILRIHRQ